MDGAGEKRDRYPLSLRILHWIRALLILAMIPLGWYMVSLPDAAPAKFATLYPLHKEFGVLTFLVASTQLAIRSRSKLPAPPVGLARWEVCLSRVVQAGILLLVVLVPLMGYAMSSTFTQSDGVPFFFTELPELLPKNDRVFAVFQFLHRTFAYTLLALVTLHILGALKHHLLDKGGETDVLSRML